MAKKPRVLLMDAIASVQSLVRRKEKYNPKEYALAFCAGVDHALNLAADFAALGVRAEKIDGKTKKWKRCTRF
jgi:superfamily II DNA or RNA helicase